MTQVIGSLHIGGAENAVRHLALGLDRSRFEVSICCTRGLGVIAEQLKASGVDVRLAAAPDARRRYLTPMYLRRALAALRPDVINTHGTVSLLHTGPLGMFGLVPPWTHTYHFGNYPLPNRAQMAGERFFSRFISQPVAVSDVQRESIIRHHGVAPGRIITIVNGVAANPFVDDAERRARKRAELGFGPEHMVIGCVAVLSRQKGITNLLQAARGIFAHAPQVRVLVAGGGPLEQSLRQEAEALGLGDRVVFTGWRHDNLELLAALDVFVMSSLWEAMPLALLEAMAARRAIVVTDVGDNRRVVDGGRCARVVPAGDPAAIAGAVLELVANPAEAAALAARAFERYTERFTTARMLADYEAVYERAANGGRSQAGR